HHRAQAGQQPHGRRGHGALPCPDRRLQMPAQRRLPRLSAAAVRRRQGSEARVARTLLEGLHQGRELTVNDISLSPSARNRDFILRVVSRYGALFLLFMHIPFALAIGPAYWLNTVIPSAAITCLHFLMPLILPRFGPLVGAMW